MSTYCVTFRISDQTVNGKTYSQRRQQIVDNARTENMGYWDETTSFFLVESTLQTPDFARKVCSGLSERHDMVVVFDPEDMSANYFGAVEHVEVLHSFMPKLKKLP